MPSEVELLCLKFPNIKHTITESPPNKKPITIVRDYLNDENENDNDDDVQNIKIEV